MSDVIYQDKAGVLVSATVVRIGDETYSTPNITSVRVKSTPLAVQAVGILVLGFLAIKLFIGQHFISAFLCAFFAAGVLLARAKLFITTSGGERRALASSASHCVAVRDAIVRAMQARR